MEIKLLNDDKKLIITNEGLDNNNFVSLRIGNEEIDVTIDELLAAVFSFHKYKQYRNETEKSYK